MAFGNILNDIKGVLATIGSFSKGGSNTYPDSVGNVSVAQISNRPQYNNKDWKSSRGYAFQVYEVDPNGNALKENAAWKEFRLQINPQELNQDEVFAIEVTPTAHGVVVEHQGSLIKDISISGTTGVSPNRRDGGAFADTGNPVFQEGHSGYKEFHELRTYFRMYAEAKRLDSQSRNLRMVFKNFKDNEYLFVEPQKFSMKRSAAKPMMYEYNISMKGIGVASGSKPAESDWLAKLNSINDVFEDVQDYFDAATKIINASMGIILRFERDIESTLLNPVLAIRQACAAVRNGSALVLSENGITRKKVEDTRKNAERIEANFNEAIGRNMTDYNRISGRTRTVVVVVGRQSTYTELQLLNAIGMIKKALLLIESQQEKVFSKDIFATNAEVASQYNNKIDLISPTSVKEVPILGNDDLQTIAFRYFGDPDKYKDLILLNNLKPPYISDTPSQGVLTPGMKILIPQTSASSGSTGVKKNKSYNVTASMSEAEKSLGVDIRLTEDGDLAISNTNDLDLIGGIENFAQALTMRLSLEKGSLKRHSFIGTSLQTGRKATASALSDLKQEIVTSVTSDPRVLSMPFIELKQEGGTISINMIVMVRNVEQPVPIPITVNA